MDIFLILLLILLAVIIVWVIWICCELSWTWGPTPFRYLRSLRIPECSRCAYYVIFPNKCRRAAAVDWYNRRKCTNDRIVPVEKVRGCSGCIFSSAEEHGYIDPKSREGEWNSVNGASQ